MKKVIIDGVEYVPKEKKSSTQGLTDRELINRAAFERDENIDPVEYKKQYDESHRVW